MKLVLNVATLERLIGGDSEVEVELRKNIVHEFGKRHLAAVAKVIVEDLEKVRKDVYDQVLKDIGITKVWVSGGDIRMTEELKTRIKAMVFERLEVEARKIVKEETQLEVERLRERIPDMVNAYAKAHLQEILNKL